MSTSPQLVYRFTDGVLTAIHERLASVPPERGGALLAVADLVHLLLEDTFGGYSSASWDISPQLAAAVGAVEAAGHGVLVGTCHTHPPGMPDPSSTDVRTTIRALDLNPHLPELLIAVVTEGRPRAHDIAVGSDHRMSLHVVRRVPDGAPDLTRVRVREVPIASDLRRSGIVLSSATSTDDWPTSGDVAAGAAAGLPMSVPVEGRDRMLVPVDGGSALLFAPEYPICGPLVLTGRDGGLSLGSSPWDPTLVAHAQLAALVAGATGRALADANVRIDPLVGSLRDKHVLVAGAGSVGSRLAEDLVRAGVGRLTLIDPDVVTAANLARTVYTAVDIDEAKCAALARRQRAINPAVRIHTHEVPLGEVDLAGVLDGDADAPAVDLVIGGTDDMAEQALLAHTAYHRGIPMVACALYRAAAAGEVVVVVPAARTACWLCATGQHAGASPHRPDPDYGLGGRLDGEIALGPPIQLVASVAAMCAIGLLAGPERPAGQPLIRLLRERRTFGLIATAPEWEWFPMVFAGMAHQQAPQSVWMVVAANPDCTVCGDHPVPPASRELGADMAELVTLLKNETTLPSG